MIETEAKVETRNGTNADADYVLLQRFLQEQDEAAFTDIVQRHSAIVIGVCQRVLRNEHDAEDAFQATFLVLAKNAHKVRKTSSLSSWLYCVAYRISNRRSQKKRALREFDLRNEPVDSKNAFDVVANAHDYDLVDDELNRLPEKYRDPLVLYYLLGKSNRQISEELGTSVGVIEGRLKRGKHELRTRLARRGVNLAIVMTAMQVIQSSAQAAASSELILTTAKAGSFFLTRSSVPQLSDRAIDMADRELGATGAKASTSTLLVTVVAVVMIGFTGHRIADGNEVGKTATSPIESRLHTLSPSKSKLANTELIAALDNAESSEATTLSKDENSGIQAQSIRQLTQKERSIAAILEEKSAVEFDANPIRDTLTYLSDVHNTSIGLDERSLKKAGIDPDEPVYLTVKDARLESVLNQILKPNGLTYIFENDQLLVTTIQEAVRRPKTTVYNTINLTGPGTVPLMSNSELAEIIQSTIEPRSWRTEGGAGVIKEIPDGLVINAPQPIHRHILSLMRQLIEHAHNPK